MRIGFISGMRSWKAGALQEECGCRMRVVSYSGKKHAASGLLWLFGERKVLQIYLFGPEDFDAVRRAFPEAAIIEWASVSRGGQKSNL